MCGIAGIVALNGLVEPDVVAYLEQVLISNADRGHHSMGGIKHTRSGMDKCTLTSENIDRNDIDIKDRARALASWAVGSKLALFNCRGTPTTEVEVTDNKWNPSDLQDHERQPYTDGQYTWIVHNGLINNDLSIGDKYNLWYYEKGLEIDSYAILKEYQRGGDNYWQNLSGSWAWMIYNYKTMEFDISRTYLGLYMSVIELSGIKYLVFSSEEKPLHGTPNRFVTEIPPYTYGRFDVLDLKDLYESPLSAISDCILNQLCDIQTYNYSDHAVVIHSGGLDSTVSAVVAARSHKTITLMHFDYGCKATSKELEAVNNICSYIKAHINPNVNVRVEHLDWLKRLGGSTLVDDQDNIARGESGAETASEWVPARNLVMISSVAAYCDAQDAGYIYLGLNREEASVFNDNSSEFFSVMERALLLGTKSMPQIVCPVGNMMKVDIVKYGQSIGAPLDLTWSCYHDQRCYEQPESEWCGPCLNTDRAFALNGVTRPW